MRGVRGSLILLLFVVFFSHSIAQEIRVEGGFVEDSMLIGKPVSYWMTASYPLELEMVLPDSLFSFAPFEYNSKEYFPTRLVDNLAFDSTVYKIESFEIDLVQYLSMPAITLDGQDSLVVRTSLDSIYLMQLAHMVSDTTQLIANSNYETVTTFFNFPLLYVVLGLLVIVAGVVFLIYGNKLMKILKLRRMQKDYQKFSDGLSHYIQGLKQSPEADLAEQALVYWKQYQERLDKYPFTKLTTKEILAQSFTKELEKPLHSIDRLVYGKRDTETVFQDFQQIEDFAQHRYNKKVAEIKDGK